LSLGFDHEEKFAPNFHNGRFNDCGLLAQSLFKPNRPVTAHCGAGDISNYGKEE
jgi:hypothetical protein